MSGNSSTTLPNGAGGPVLYVEDIGGGVKLTGQKIHPGALGADGGPVTASNPYPTRDYDGSSNPVWPTAAAAADAESASTVLSRAGLRLFGFNGSTWDRARAGVTSIGSTFAGYLSGIPAALYRSTRTARTTGQGGPLEANAQGDVTHSPARMSCAYYGDSTIPSTGVQVYLGACYGLAVCIANTSGGTVFVFIYDANAAPTNGQAPYIVAGSIANNVAGRLDIGPPGCHVKFNTGIWMAMSGVSASWSDTGSNLFVGNVTYYAL